MKKTIMIIAGETSSDRLGGNLVTELESINPDLTFIGYGGLRMKQAGVEILYDLVSLALIGFIEVIRHLGLFYKILKEIESRLSSGSVDLLILIDYPGLNMRVARLGRKYNVPVIYYVSPQTWAWGKDREKKLAELVNLMIVIFPFEEKFYKDVGCPVEYVGHPLVEYAHPSKPYQELISEFGLDSENPIIGIFPGSRKQEIYHHLPVILETINPLQIERPKIQWILCESESLPEGYINTGGNIKSIRGRVYDIMSVSNFIIASSGTVTTESLLISTPVIVIYKVSLLSYIIGRFLVKVPHISMINILAGKRLVPELIQGDLTMRNLKRHITRFIDIPDLLNKIRADMKSVKVELGDAGASRRAAALVNSFLQKGNISK